MKKTLIIAFAFVLYKDTCGQSAVKKYAQEPYRPQIHFSPREHWMNDPNGMIFYKGVYHLFYQYYPGATVWGPMHWGHATSKDMIHWMHEPIALYPDSLGYIFSGSAVADIHNSSGLGKYGKIPIVAIFTSHDPKGEKEGKNNYQNESIAYSLDEGKTWIKYSGNPVLKNPGIKDFRDPKVSWYEAGKKWIMTLATQDHITFFSSKDLKNWSKESEFGKEVGAHGGVWECPDLFPLTYNCQQIWILLVSINPGGPNGGSATQYFTGQFDGKTFTPYQTDTRWVDYGPDDYAGVTWSNTGNRKLFIGWMSNWEYATVVPTVKWRSAMTIPRTLNLKKVDGKFFIQSMPVKELDMIHENTFIEKNIEADTYHLTAKAGSLNGPVQLDIHSDKIKSYSIILSNSSGEKVTIGYDQTTNEYYIDRTGSGKIDFKKSFAGKFSAPRLSHNNTTDCTLVIDRASAELFADSGLTVMTAIFFPTETYSDITFKSSTHFTIKSLKLTRLKSILQ